METLLILNIVKYWVLRIELVSIHNIEKYPRWPSATVGNHMGMHQIPLDTFGNSDFSNHLLLKRFLRRTRNNWKMEMIDHLFESIHSVYSNKSHQNTIYRQLLLATQIPSIPRYLTVFGLPKSNTEYCQIPPNTIWELAFTNSCSSSGSGSNISGSGSSSSSSCCCCCCCCCNSSYISNSSSSSSSSSISMYQVIYCKSSAPLEANITHKI